MDEESAKMTWMMFVLTPLLVGFILYSRSFIFSGVFPNELIIILLMSFWMMGTHEGLDYILKRGKFKRKVKTWRKKSKD